MDEDGERMLPFAKTLKQADEKKGPIDGPFVFAHSAYLPPIETASAGGAPSGAFGSSITALRPPRPRHAE